MQKNDFSGLPFSSFSHAHNIVSMHPLARGNRRSLLYAPPHPRPPGPQRRRNLRREFHGRNQYKRGAHPCICFSLLREGKGHCPLVILIIAI